jgi:hypothetical protein
MMQHNSPAPRDGVEDHHCPTANEYLNVLSPRCEQLWEGNASAWIFRGQANAEWELKPTAVRDPKVFAKYGIRSPSVHPGYVPNSVPAWSERAGFQELLLLRFREGLERSGLVIPTRSPRVRRQEMNETFSSAEPLREAFPLMALAQHHGLPTMLLDWTRRAWVAAYFAAAEAADKERRGTTTHLAVWALLRGGLQDPTEGTHFYEAPGGTNPNLHAQAGLFTLHFGEDDPSLEQHFVRVKRITGSVPILKRITLPTSEAPRLLRLLSDEGIHGASMFPGPDGVVRSMRENALWG